MAQYAVPQYGPRPLETPAATHIVSPAPLGLGIIGITTAIVGCFYTGFIIPFNASPMRMAVGATLLIGGLILLLAGMWEFPKGYLMTATTFTAYGGFLGMIGLILTPSNYRDGVAALPEKNAVLGFLPCFQRLYDRT